MYVLWHDFQNFRYRYYWIPFSLACLRSDDKIFYKSGVWYVLTTIGRAIPAGVHGISGSFDLFSAELFLQIIPFGWQPVS